MSKIEDIKIIDRLNLIYKFMLYDVARRHYILTFKAVPLIYNFHMVSHNFLQNPVFIGSYPTYESLPDDSGSEIAFCGRSN